MYIETDRMVVRDFAMDDLHHLTGEEKNSFTSTLRGHLKENGKIIIGDVE